MTNVKSLDRKEILAHIDSIFRAYIRKDRKTIRDTHTPDWTGFQGPSTKIERGIEAYMVNAEKSLAQVDGTGYELLDHEIQIAVRARLIPGHRAEDAQLPNAKTQNRIPVFFTLR